MLGLSGIGSERVQIRWVSASEGQLFAERIKELSKMTQDLGPLDPERFEVQFGALQAALNSPRLRWMVGVDRQVTQKENVYHEKIDRNRFKQLLANSLDAEYYQSLILELLKKGPLTVREMSSATDLPVYKVSLLLGELERSGKADLHGYEGVTPRFARVAA